MSTTPPPARPGYDLDDDTASRRPDPLPFDVTPDRPYRATPEAAVPPPSKLRGLRFLGMVPLVLLLLKLGSASKILLPLVSFGATIWLYTKLVPGGAFWLIFGIFTMIFLHECGHAFAARRFGLKYEGMVFTPFGGVVFHRPGDTNVVQDAFIGIMGPVTGAVCAVVCAIVAHITGQKFFFGLGAACFAINLANLAPGGPLDGGWIGAVFSRKLSPRFYSIRQEGKSAEYFCATANDKIKYGFAWGGLALFLLLGAGWCNYAPYFMD
jgi:Zn-dependent protease